MSLLFKITVVSFVCANHENTLMFVFRYPAHNELRDLDFAFETWNRETCVQFRPRQNGDQAWIRITDGDKCADCFCISFMIKIVL